MKFRDSRAFRPLMVIIGILAAVLVFILVFFVPDSHAEVVGCTRYTDAEVRKMVFDSFLNRNSLYLSFIKKKIVPENAAFIRSIDIEFKGPGRVVLSVDENNPIGYVEQDGNDYYFDSDGVVIEAEAVEGWTPEAEEDESVNADSSESVASSSVSSSSSADTEGTEPLVDLDGDGIYDTTQEEIWLVDTDGDGYPDQTTSGEDLVDTDKDGIPDASRVTPTPAPEPTEAVSSSSSEENPIEAVTADSAGAAGGDTVSDSSGALTAVMEKSSDTEFHPALADVTEITGLTDQKLSVGAKIEVEDSTIFSTIRAIAQIINKLQIKPDSISLDESYNMTLHYGDTQCMIGGDNLLEEKMSRVAAILPQIQGTKGTLHLENFSENTVNIVFDKG